MRTDNIESVAGAYPSDNGVIETIEEPKKIISEPPSSTLPKHGSIPRPMH